MLPLLFVVMLACLAPTVAAAHHLPAIERAIEQEVRAFETLTRGSPADADLVQLRDRLDRLDRTLAEIPPSPDENPATIARLRRRILLCLDEVGRRLRRTPDTFEGITRETDRLVGELDSETLKPPDQQSPKIFANVQSQAQDLLRRFDLLDLGPGLKRIMARGRLLTLIDDAERATRQRDADLYRQRYFAEAQRAEQLREEARREEARRKEDARRAMIRSKGWPAAVTEAAIQKQVAIGMTREQVEAAWGKPESIRETVTAGGTSEQWVYRGFNYLSFQDGILRSMSLSR